MTLTGVLQGQVPLECKRLFPNYEHHRQALKDSLREQLFKDNKQLLKLRVLADGWVADWEEIVPGQNGSCTSYSGMHQVSISAIGTKSEPVDLTLWDDDKHEFKQDTKWVEPQATSIPKPEPAEPVNRPRDPLEVSRHLPRHPSHDMHVDSANQHRIDIPPVDGRLPARPTALLPEDEALVHPPPRPRTPTGPRNTRLNPDAPYLPRRPLVFQRESASSDHQYIRSDQPGSLQLHRLTPSKAAVRDVHRTRLMRREWAERRGGRDQYCRDGRYEEDYRPSKWVALEDQQSVYRRTMGRGRGRRATEWSETNAISASHPTRTQEQSMQIDTPATPQQPRLDLVEERMTQPSMSGEEAGTPLFIPERPTSPDMDHDMLEEELFMEETTVPDARSIPPNDASMNTSVLTKEVLDDDEDELDSLSSSSSDDSSEETKPLDPRNRVAPKAQQKGAADLLASINFASVKDILDETASGPNPPPPISGPAPRMLKGSLDGKPPIIRTTRPSTSTSNATLQHPYAKPSGSSNSKSAYINPDPDSDSDSDSNLKAKVNLKSKVKAPPRPPRPPPRLSVQYRHAETIKLPKPDYARARRLLAPLDKPLVCVSMPGDVQFVRDDERVRVEGWSLPAPARPKGGEGKKVAYVVTDACLLGDSNVVMVHETGPHPASIVCIPDDYDDVPVRHDLSHVLVPASSIQRRGILSSVCALDSHQFFTGCMDKRVLLWDIGALDEGAPKASIEALDTAHAASVRALAYSPSRSWLVSAAGSKLAVTDVSTGQVIVKAGKQKWASNDVFNVHFHSRDPNMLLVETGDLDKQARIYDLRKIRKTELAPERLIGSTETGAISQYVRGDWAKSLVVRPSSLNMVKVWDTRQPDRPLSVHTLSHTVTHCIFIDDCRTIAATGEHFVTFLDARV